MAFNAKKLEYEKKEPAFLRRLKGEFSGLDGRNNVQIVRPKKDRLRTGDDEEDEPVIVDEQGQRIEKAEFERRAKGEEEAERPDFTEEEKGSASAEKVVKQTVMEIGTASNVKKRKAGKIVGGGEGNNEGSVDEKIEEKTSSREEPDKVPLPKKKVAAPKKKAKKIKLSFDEPE